MRASKTPLELIDRIALLLPPPPHAATPLLRRSGSEFALASGGDFHKILEHIGIDPEAPRITPARGPPLWDDCGAQEQEQSVGAMPDWDITSQSAPDYPDDQRTTG